ncbi:FMN-dependent NADH-azoreductase [Acinetobacter pseudolwoffii]|uniref:FMN-dependent NADH-azoreductase n=1 Tax=Acinetobacter pseudolwoffii TaxID=2053287 RepID=UPI003FD789A7
MSNILVLKSSFMQNNSLSNQLIGEYLFRRRQHGYVDQIIEHNLAVMNLPVLDSEIFNALRGEVTTKPEVQSAIALSDKFIKELKECDLLLIAVPMYNLNVPTQLKNWFDLIARAQVTFQYTETEPVGLIKGVRSVIFNSCGGIHKGLSTDAVTPYLKSVLGLIGIDDVSFIYAEGTDIQPSGKSEALKSAIQQIDIHFTV